MVTPISDHLQYDTTSCFYRIHLHKPSLWQRVSVLKGSRLSLGLGLLYTDIVNRPDHPLPLVSQTSKILFHLDKDQTSQSIQRLKFNVSRLLAGDWSIKP